MLKLNLMMTFNLLFLGIFYGSYLYAEEKGLKWFDGESYHQSYPLSAPVAKGLARAKSEDSNSNSNFIPDTLFSDWPDGGGRIRSFSGAMIVVLKEKNKKNHDLILNNIRKSYSLKIEKNKVMNLKNYYILVGPSGVEGLNLVSLLGKDKAIEKVIPDWKTYFRGRRSIHPKLKNSYISVRET